ncbi:MAG: tRNA(Glu)-specific nuclease WapA [Chlamydiae bacterium]|nr:tRNA(Glu)-specific nuclease WapA [Chlamydiota bacterium]
MIRALMTLICWLFAIPAFSYDEEAKEEFFLSTPEQVASLSSEPSYLVGSIVSPLSGSPTLRQHDLVVKGAQELILSRTYMSPHMPVQLAYEKKNREEWEKYHLYQHVAHHYKGWQFYPHLKLQFMPSQKQVLVTDPSGSTLCFSFAGPGMTGAKLEGEPYGLSNSNGESPSGANDPRNTRITYDDDDNRITVYGVDRTIRFYCFSKWDSNEEQIYLLEKEILSNGKVLKYHYEGQQPSYVESLDPQERFVYASIRIQGSPWKGHCHFLSSSGTSADYKYQKRSTHVEIKEETKHWYGNDRLEREYNFLCPPILSRVSSPNFRNEQLDYCGRFLLNSCEGRENYFQLVNKGYGEGSGHYRVHQLSLPVGENDAFIPVYELSYQPPVAGEKGGKTTVKASDGTSTIYHFSKKLLTSKIQYLGEDGALKKEKIFSWNDKNWLKAVEYRDGQKHPFYKKAFEYEQFGNPILETFTGDLSGSGDLESTWTKRIFSDDGKNLLLREETENGNVTCFSYLKGTDLILSKLIQDGDRIIRREFCIYDDCHNLIKKVSDDGEGSDQEDLSGVTERHSTTYILRQSAPFLHMPEWVTQTYLESGIEKPHKKSHLIYDAQGNVAQEEIYDAEGNLAYTIYKTHNERGDLLSETNRLGQETTYTYDAKGHRKTETNFSGRINKALSHDIKGRLHKIVEEGDDGTRHTISSKHDFHDRLIERKDSFKNRTFYKYDSLVNEVIQTDFPQITDLEGKSVNVATFSTYDPFGRELISTDPNGNTTTYRYNVYGLLSEINHPCGGKEIFRYAKNGDLIAYTDPDGLIIRYENDVLGRVLRKTYISPKGERIAEETFTYSGFNLLSETDKEGQERLYFYDGAGRKVREEFCGKVTEFAYDSLGRLAALYKYNGDDALVTHYERDLEDRVIEEKKTDLSGHILYKTHYAYDADGNRETITRFINGEEAIESFAYDPFQRKIHQRDALGYETLTSYDENYTNALGQKVLQIRKVDPKGITTLKTQDALTRSVRVERLGAGGQIVSCHEITQDPQGNLLLHRDHIYEDSRFQSTRAIRYFYTPDHQVKSITRGYGTHDARETAYSYLPSGKMEKKTLSDGITLFYNYHPLGYLNRVDSSDGMIRHAFTHNRLGHLLTAVDEKQNLTIQREVDFLGNVTCEVFPHGAQIAKTYDDFSRPLSLEIAGHGQVRYTYDPLFLREVERISSHGSVLYKHAFEEYDLDGNLTREHLIGNLDSVIHATDLRGQKTHISSPYFSQECKYNSVQDLISSTTDRAESLYQYDDTSQMTREEGSGNTVFYCNDSLCNRTRKNESLYEINVLNELLSNGKAHYEYDLRGNQVLKKTNTQQLQMIYDPLNQLIKIQSQEQKTEFIYDPLGRRLAKVISTQIGYGWKESDREYYLYDGDDEIGSFKPSNILESFRVLNTHRLPKTVSIEIGGKIFAPLTDVQGNICRLIDVQSKTLAASYDFTAFGERLQTSTKGDLQSPWQFASKRFDSELDLIYFGKRHYDPGIGRWLTTDPAGFEDSFNPYQYVLNNPFRYYDPNGESLGGYLLGIGEIALGGAIMITGGVIEIGSFGTLTIGFAFAETMGASLVMSGLATTAHHAQDIKFPNISWKNTDVYAPDRPLPREPRTKEPVPETNVPHTELGTKDGTKGKYPQAREFDAQGKPVKDIDFTNHGRPQNHPNPHEHKWKPNQTGGTPKRSPEAEPVS